MSVNDFPLTSELELAQKLAEAFLYDERPVVRKPTFDAETNAYHFILVLRGGRHIVGWTLPDSAWNDDAAILTSFENAVSKAGLAGIVKVRMPTVPIAAPAAAPPVNPPEPMVMPTVKATLKESPEDRLKRLVTAFLSTTDSSVFEGAVVTLEPQPDPATVVARVAVGAAAVDVAVGIEFLDDEDVADADLSTYIADALIKGTPGAISHSGKSETAPTLPNFLKLSRLQVLGIAHDDYGMDVKTATTKTEAENFIRAAVAEQQSKAKK